MASVAILTIGNGLGLASAIWFFRRNLRPEGARTSESARGLRLYAKILVGLLAGTFLGVTANLVPVGPLADILDVIEPVAEAFVTLMIMIVIPLVVAGVIASAASLGNLRGVGRITGKTLVYYLITSAIAVTTGAILTIAIRPGSVVSEETREQAATLAEVGYGAAFATPRWTDILRDIIPRNPIQAAADMDLYRTRFPGQVGGLIRPPFG